MGGKEGRKVRLLSRKKRRRKMGLVADFRVCGKEEKRDKAAA